MKIIFVLAWLFAIALLIACLTIIFSFAVADYRLGSIAEIPICGGALSGNMASKVLRRLCL